MVRVPRGPVAYNLRAGGWPPGTVVPAGTHLPRRVLPPSLPPHLYRVPSRVPIGPYGFAQGIIAAGGGLTLNVGPAGFNTGWELAQASITTSTGPADTSTVAFFAQPFGTPSTAWQVGQSYQGGGDQIPLSGIKLVTGEYLFAVWSGAKPGDTATLVLTGVMLVLT